ncbi:hypothetical protein RISK_004986 [Rhodopirellula islandica]|uniref:Uncharacterized protein n=1 Tax=Rhodopirellula islandica TaxID=595434 RepID=A0A0J1B983_RHOIS|nr:hypothetical protein RISK_004986 [Rhodopirellula islandica]
MMDGWFVITPRLVPKHWLGCHVEHGLREDASCGGSLGRWFGLLRSVGVACLSIPADMIAEGRSNATLRIRCIDQVYEI